MTFVFVRSVAYSLTRFYIRFINIYMIGSGRAAEVSDVNSFLAQLMVVGLSCKRVLYVDVNVFHSPIQVIEVSTYANRNETLKLNCLARFGMYLISN